MRSNVRSKTFLKRLDIRSKINELSSAVVPSSDESTGAKMRFSYAINSSKLCKNESKMTRNKDKTTERVYWRIAN